MRRFAFLTAALALLVATPARVQAQGAVAIKNNAFPLPVVPSELTNTSIPRMCPDGSVMTGLRARVGLVVDAVGLRCRQVNSNGTLGAESSVGLMAGGTGGTERIRSCPTGTVAVGQHIGYEVSTKAIILIGLDCRAWNADTRTTTGSVAMLQVVSSAAAALTTRSARCAESAHAIRGFRAQTGTLDVLATLGFTCGKA